MNSRAGFGCLLFAAATVFSRVAGADEPQRCAAMDNDRDRLACYDSIFRRPGPSAATVPSSAAVPVATGAAAGTVAAAPAAAAAGSPEADFGLTEAAKRAREPAESIEKFPDSITGRVASVSRQPAGELIVTLENGQVWTQLQVDPRARVAAGDTVTIKKAALGSHMLVTASRYATRVRRVK